MDLHHRKHAGVGEGGTVCGWTPLGVFWVKNKRQKNVTQTVQSSTQGITELMMKLGSPRERAEREVHALASKTLPLEDEDLYCVRGIDMVLLLTKIELTRHTK